MAGEVHVFKITVKGVDFFKATQGRPINNAQLESIDRMNDWLHIVAEACEVDLHRWYNEADDSIGPYPQGTLITFHRVGANEDYAAWD